MATNRTSIYPTDEDKLLLSRIEEQYGIKASTAYRVGLRLLAETLDGNRINERRETMDYRLTTEDRVAQVGWLREFAADIVQNLGDGTAEELVEYALSDEGRESWAIEIPDWFDGHDRKLLTEMVADSL